MKITYSNNLDIKKVTDNRTFWKTVVPMFSNKFSRNEKINLTEENEVVSTDSELSRVFDNFSSNAVENLKFQVFQILRTKKVMTHFKKKKTTQVL